ncbi:MAG: 50S ribosomal protein L10 [Firmicutes bacterium]|nr:50S ribosomal protein L10 [Bacillota bacterium]
MPSEVILNQKKEIVAGLTEQLKAACIGVVVDYKGITVEDDTKLRKELREAGVKYSVVKNTLLGRAADEVGLGDIKSVLNGTSAIAMCDDDYVGACRILCKYADEHENFNVKIGFCDGEVVSADYINQLAKVPPKETLLAMLAGGLNATIAGLARALNAVAEKQEA